MCVCFNCQQPEVPLSLCNSLQQQLGDFALMVFVAYSSIVDLICKNIGVSCTVTFRQNDGGGDIVR